MSEFEITPQVNASQEFTEIANDFANPLDVVREAISNSFDAGASMIEISFDVIRPAGKRTLRITISDDGEGMDNNGLQSLFDLGNSLRRGDPEVIGEKGHGTKVFFNSSSISVETTRNEITCSTLDDPVAI
ncbi:MAG TPA: ATP-binding protein [Desulfomonilaceae bacterium]|nr:ATP-binding protein [Desulfomonilaceae bacterium]